MTKKNEVLFTKEGLEELKTEYDKLVNKQRPAILEELQSARSLGDLSENSMYHAARERQSFIEGRIREVEELLKKAKVSKTSSKKGGQIGLGKRVTLEIQKKKIDFHIVGPEEVDTAKNKISHESPLGSALMGRGIGDLIDVQTPSGKMQYKVIDIS